MTTNGRLAQLRQSSTHEIFWQGYVKRFVFSTPQLYLVNGSAASWTSSTSNLQGKRVEWILI
jgi:hypothetical protein